MLIGKVLCIIENSPIQTITLIYIMKLKKAHKEILLTWIAEGFLTDEINDRAAEFEQPFNVSREQVAYYRRSRNEKIKELKESYENKALNTGLARKGVRVQKLQRLAALLEHDLFAKGLTWVEDKKGVGSGDIAEIYDFEEFNKSEIDAYRGVLDDIAKEMGHRVLKVAPTDPTGTKEYGSDARDAIISKLLPGLALGDEEGETGESNG